MPNSERKLRYVLLSNAVFSLLSGAGMSFFHPGIAEVMGVVNPNILLYIGLALIGFSATVFYTASKRAISPKQVKSIIIQDWIWVFGSLVIIVFHAWDLTENAYWIIGVVALIVGVFFGGTE